MPIDSSIPSDGLAQLGGGRDPDPDDPEVARVRALLESRFGLPDAAIAPGIGRYRVLDRIGAGAMGVVYRGYDPELERPVALKLLHAELDSPELRERLLREARAMARLSSAHVATVFETGVYADRSFVAMELVRGRTLRQWQQQERPRWADVLVAYRQAALGLADAHDAGIVHRDFKPDNAMIDANGRVKVLDFGLARSHGVADAAAETQDDAESAVVLDVTPQTRSGALVGTPAYMAPELLAGGGADAYSDQFAYCVALFEALNGERPFAGRTTSELLTATRRGSVVPGTSHAPAWVHRIIVRGLAVEPGARWPSLRALATALDRDPRRARRRVLGLALVGVAGVGAWSWQRLDDARAIAACDLAGAQIDEVWNDSVHARVSEAFAASELGFAADSAARVRPLLDAQAEAWRSARTTTCVNAEIERVWSDERVAAATWCLDERRIELAALVADLEQPDAAAITGAIAKAAALEPVAPCIDPALFDRLPVPPPDQRDVVRGLREQLAAIDADAGTTDARARVDEVIEAARAADWPPLLARALVERGAVAFAEGDYDQAQADDRDAYFTAASMDAWDVASDASLALVGLLGDRLARPDMALEWSRNAELAIAQLGDPSGLRTARLLDALGRTRFRQGALDEAADDLQRAADLREQALGPDHFGLVASWTALGIVEGARGDGPAALALFERALAASEAAHGPDHPDVATDLMNLANVRLMVGDDAGAEAALTRALAITEAAYGPEHPDVGQTLSNLGLLYYRAGDSARARPLLERALAIREAGLGPTHPDLVSTMISLASSLSELGETAKAVAMMKRGLAITEAARGRDHPEVAYSLRSLGMMAFNAGDVAEARAQYARSIEIFEKSRGAEHTDVAETLVELASELTKLRDDDALTAFARGIAIYDLGPEALPGEGAARFGYAQALVELRGDVVLACPQATIAREQLRSTSTPFDPSGTDVDAWIAAHCP